MTPMSRSTTDTPAPGVPLLVVESVSKAWADAGVRALEDVGFEAKAGEVVAVTGPSGCGKTTLLSIIGLLDRPDRGRVLIAGEDISRVRRPAQFRARTIGFVFQHHYMVPTMTLAENVAAPLVARDVASRERRTRAHELLERLGLAARADFLPARVSGGERQRAALARALIGEPALVLADEPTGQLDTANGRQVLALLVRQARERGALILVATHNPEIVAQADRWVALRDGRVVGFGGPAAHAVAAAGPGRVP